MKVSHMIHRGSQSLLSCELYTVFLGSTGSQWLLSRLEVTFTGPFNFPSQEETGYLHPMLKWVMSRSQGLRLKAKTVNAVRPSFLSVHFLWNLRFVWCVVYVYVLCIEIRPKNVSGVIIIWLNDIPETTGETNRSMRNINVKVTLWD